MSLPETLRRKLVLPAICAPMKDVSGPRLVTAALKAGIGAGLPAHNARDLDEFEHWLDGIRRDLAADREAGRMVGPLAVNVAHATTAEEYKRFFHACRGAGVEIYISVFGDPTEHVKRAHDFGGLAFHDVTSVRHAEKAIDAGVDGLIAIGAGGGGHSGMISHLAFVPLLRRMFNGVIVMAGAVSTGAVIRAAEILGADLAYLGTRFIATQESESPDSYKQHIVDGGIGDLIYTGNPTGVPANWLRAGLRSVGLDPEKLPDRISPHGPQHYPAAVRPWQDIGSAGHGLALIDDVPAVAELVLRLRREYVAACAIADFAEVARLTESAMEAAQP